MDSVSVEPAGTPEEPRCVQIQATLSATAQMQATQMAVNADRTAAQDAAMSRFNSAPAVTPIQGKDW